jgi:tetratricopeptide (TPR) repeat protein
MNPLYKINALRWLLMGAVAEISNNPAAAGAKPLSPDPWKKLPVARQAEVEQEARVLAALQSLPEVVQGMVDKILLSYEVFSGRPDEAIARAIRMMGSKQTDRVGYSSLCAIYVQLEKWPELSALAKQWYAKNKSPETALLWIKSARKASNTAEEAAGIAAMKADYQRELLTKQTLAVHAALAGKYEESIDLLTTVTKIDPGNTEAWITLAATQQLAGKKEAALNAIRSAVSSDPQNPLATELYNILNKN